MKKLMILAAVAMTAVVTQAYDLKWGAISIYIPVAADATKSELGIVAVKENGSFAAGALAVQLYWVSTTGNEYIGEYKTTGEGEIASQVIASGTDSALYKAMVADHGKDWLLEYYYTATYTTDTGTYVYAGTTTSRAIKIGGLETADRSLTVNFKASGTWDYTAKPVPEPTSAMLMLLGVAGLCLRRKQK